MLSWIMFLIGKLLILKVWKWKYYNKKLKMTFKLLRSSNMLTFREMDKFNFSLTQVYSNDCVPFAFSVSSFIMETKYVGCPGGYNI